MRAINHTVTGAIIGAAVVNPWVALPAALLSHLILDVIPHYDDKRVSHSSVRFKLELLVDAALSAAFLLSLALLQPAHWPLLAACGVLGAAPDLWWFPYWVMELKTGKAPVFDRVGKFLGRIQWSQTPPGIIVEVVWLIGALYVFFVITA
jgi:hypothetical protein